MRMVFLAYVATIYVVTVIFSGIVTRIDYPDNRLLSPAYVPIVILAVAALWRLVQRLFKTPKQ